MIDKDAVRLGHRVYVSYSKDSKTRIEEATVDDIEITGKWGRIICQVDSDPTLRLVRTPYMVHYTKEEAKQSLLSGLQNNLRNTLQTIQEIEAL